MSNWETPDWVREGRTGPHGPRYAKASDRRQVRRDYAKAEHGGCLSASLALAGVGAVFLAAVAAFGWAAVEFVAGAI